MPGSRSERTRNLNSQMERSQTSSMKRHESTIKSRNYVAQSLAVAGTLGRPAPLLLTASRRDANYLNLVPLGSISYHGLESTKVQLAINLTHGAGAEKWLRTTM